MVGPFQWADLQFAGHDRGPHIPTLERAKVPGGEWANLPCHEQRKYVTPPEGSYYRTLTSTW